MATPAQPVPAPLTDAELIELGRVALRIEAAAVTDLAGRLGPDFARACRACLDCDGRVVSVTDLRLATGVIISFPDQQYLSLTLPGATVSTTAPVGSTAAPVTTSG